MSGAQINPQILYINLSSAATPSSTFLSTDPNATFSESRLEPVLADVSRYQMCIVRAALQGQRNFPLLIASIQTGQPNPYLTNFQLRLSVTVSNATYEVPTSAIREMLTLRLYSPAGKAESQAALSVLGPDCADAAAVVAALDVSRQQKVAVYPFLQYVTVTSVTDALGNPHIKFTLDATADAYPGWWLTAEPSRPSSARYFGFPEAYPQDPTEGPAVTPDNNALVLPLPCSYAAGSGTSGSVGVFASLATPMIWKSQVSGVAVPAPPLAAVDEGNSNYWLYDYAWYARLFNETLANAFDEVLTAASNAGLTLQTQCPWVSYERASQGFVLHASPSAVGPTNTGIESMDLWLNEETANLMNWSGTYDQHGNQTLIWDSAKLSPDGTWAEVRPDYPATANGWSPVGSIVFKASQWMMRQEVMSAPRLYGAGSDASSSATSSSNEMSQIMSDVIPAVGDGSDFNGAQIIYAPQVLRWVELTGGASPLRELDFQVWWRNAATGKMYPVTLNPRASFSVKIMLHRVR